MPKSVAWENMLLSLLFNNTDASGIGDAIGLMGSTVAGYLYISLHTADPSTFGDGTIQLGYEPTYSGYSRVGIARTTAGWTITYNPTQVTNAAVISFIKCSGGSSIVTYIGIGTDSGGAGKLLYYGTIDPLEISLNITPTINKNVLIIGES